MYNAIIATKDSAVMANTYHHITDVSKHHLNGCTVLTYFSVMLMLCTH